MSAVRQTRGGQTHVVLPVTGSPPADPDRSGAAAANVVNDRVCLEDVGPGLVRRAHGQLAEIASRTPAGLLIPYHRGVGPRGREIIDEQYVSEIQQTCHGNVVIGHDLDLY